MNSTLSQVFILVSAAVAGGLLTKIAQVLWRKLHPSLTLDSASSTLKTLSTLQTLFGAGLASGGFLEYPWDIRGEIVREDILRSQLEAEAAAIRDKAFKVNADFIKKDLRTIFATSYRPSQRYREFQFEMTFGSTSEEPIQFRSERARLEKISSLQMEALESGSSALNEAISRIHVLLGRTS